MKNDKQFYVYVKIKNEFGTFFGAGNNMSEDDMNALYNSVRDSVANGGWMSLVMNEKECMFFPAEIMKKSLVTIHVSEQEEPANE